MICCSKKIFMQITEEKKSISKKVWYLSLPQDRDVLYIMQKYKLSEIASRIMVARGFNNQSENFLNPLLRNSLPNPFTLLDMEKAVKRVIQAIKKSEKIVVFGDYDVDGAASSALLKRYFANLNKEISIYIPDRAKEGYGPSTSALQKLKEKGFDLCITVDCGTVANEPLEEAKKIGLDVIIVDHHLGGEILPEACAIINPNRLDENFEHREIAAVGVAFLFLIALNKTLREQAFFSSIEEPNLYNYLDLVALGTVCDVMPLKNLNRVFVAQGLKIISKRQNIGIRTLADLLEIYEPLTSYHLGFLIGPNINAGGRIGRSDLGANLLSTNNEVQAQEIAEKLIQYNKERQDLEKRAVEEAINITKVEKQKIIILTSNKWHPGIIGLIANRVKDHFYLPVIVITIQDGIGKASCRSVTEIDIGALVLTAKLQGLIIEGGGHKMAAGFSIYENKIEKLSFFLNSSIASIEIQNITKIDAIASPELINMKLWSDLQKLAPFGVGNPDPKLVLQNITVNEVNIIKDKHIRCIIKDKVSGKTIRAIAFNAANTMLEEALTNNMTKKILGKIKINYWQGRTNLNFLIEDIMILP